MSASLYERLGGTEGITQIASDVVDNHMSNALINTRFVESDVDALKNAAAIISLQEPEGLMSTRAWIYTPFTKV